MEGTSNTMYSLFTLCFANERREVERNCNPSSFSQPGNEKAKNKISSLDS